MSGAGRGGRSSVAGRGWMVFGAGGVAATAVFFLLPTGGVAQGVVFVGLHAAALGALAVRIMGGRLPGRAWLLLASAHLLYLAANIGWYLYPVGLGRALPYPSPLDGAYWVAYMGWALFLVLVARQRAKSDTGVLWDAVAAASGLVVAAWPLLIEPVIEHPSAVPSVLAASVVYPSLLLVIAAMGLRVALVSRILTFRDALLGSWLVLELAGDVWCSTASANGSFRYGSPWFATWLLAYTAFGALALHPDLPGLVGPAPAERHPRPRARAVVLGSVVVAALVAIGSHRPEEHWGHDAVMVALTAASVAIILARLAAPSRDLAAEQRVHEQLSRAYADLVHAATHDALTGLANRAAFEAILPRALARRRGPGRHACVLMIDLDSFKAVNDTYGHAVGDSLLVVVASRLREVVRDGDLVARLGGDEFAVVVDDGDVRTLLALADRVVDALREPADLGGPVVHPAASVGAHASEPGESPEQALLHADAALYAAKDGGGGAELFHPERHRRFVERYRLELELRSGVGRGELVVHYQPILDLAARRVVKSEALVRWNHPTRGLLGPDDFIDMAETSGAIVDLGRWVLHRAFRDAKHWQSLPAGGGVGVAVNLSRRQLQSPNVADDISEALELAELDPGLATIEVTETALVSDTGEIVGRLEKIKALGVVLAMDDFGTGYSSLSDLSALPIDVLKIDKVFVDGIARQDEEWALASAIIRLATSLGKRTLAEGIERASQLAHLRTLGCELGQGWLFAPALPLAEFAALVANGTQPASAGPASLKGGV